MFIGWGFSKGFQIYMFIGLGFSLGFLGKPDNLVYQRKLSELKLE